MKYSEFLKLKSEYPRYVDGKNLYSSYAIKWAIFEDGQDKVGLSNKKLDFAVPVGVVGGAEYDILIPREDGEIMTSHSIHVPESERWVVHDIAREVERQALMNEGHDPWMDGRKPKLKRPFVRGIELDDKGRLAIKMAKSPTG